MFVSPRFDDKECPENYCHNGGKCMMILDVPMCSCKPGYSGSQCEDPNEADLDPDEPNTLDKSNTIEESNTIDESKTIDESNIIHESNIIT